MVKTQKTIKFTYEDYRNLPESETKRCELLGGGLFVTPSPTSEHQRISWKLNSQLSQFIQAKGLGEVFYAPLDVILSDEDVVQPDLLFVARGRLDIIHERGIQGAPDLVIEIMSPATAPRDRTYKRTLYARHGVKEFWLVDPETRTIEALTLGEWGVQTTRLFECGQTLQTPLLPGLSIELSQIF